jgi:type II secretory pathway pseudopilin PulG
MRLGSARGFTLLGLSIALFLASAVIAIATPAIMRALRAHRAHAALADLQQFASVLQQYAHDHGDWPAAGTTPGGFPPGLDTALGRTHWAEHTPIGGQYVWLVNTLQRGERVRAAIGIASTANAAVSLDQPLVDEFLRQAKTIPAINWRLRLGFHNEPVLVLEQ